MFQAGSSGRGQQFAAANAEAVFIFAPHTAYAKKTTDAVRTLARGLGRRNEDIKFFAGLSFVVGSTEAEVKSQTSMTSIWTWTRSLRMLAAASAST